MRMIKNSSRSVLDNGGNQFANAMIYNSCDKRSVEMVLKLPARGNRGGSLGTTETKAFM